MKQLLLPLLLLPLLLANCTHVSNADPNWLMRYAPEGLEEAPLGKWDTKDIRYRIVGLEKVPLQRRAQFVRAIEAGAEIWEEVRAAGLELSRVPGEEEAEITYYVDDRDHWRPGYLALAYPPASAHPGAILIRYDSFGKDIWHTGHTLWESPSLIPSPSGFMPLPSGKSLRFTAAHEMGHALGLPHIDYRGALMLENAQNRDVELDVEDAGALVAVYWTPAKQWVAKLRADRFGRWPTIQSQGAGWGRGSPPGP